MKAQISKDPLGRPALLCRSDAHALSGDLVVSTGARFLRQVVTRDGLTLHRALAVMS